jgi:hypothetical protein
MNLRREVWTIRPKPRAIRKIFFKLFVILKGKRIDSHEFEKALGCLSWYMKGMPYGTAFLRSLFACKVKKHTRRYIFLSHSAIMDLQWLRAMMIIFMKSPDLLACPIGHVRVNLAPTLWIYSDASTSVGGGAALCRSEELVDSNIIGTSAIRWSADEFEIFSQQEVTINTLEFYAVIYHMLLWGKEIQGVVLKVYCDNTSAVSWIHKQRGNAKSDVTMALVRVLSLWCLVSKVVVISTHIPGVDNTLADDLSRNLSMNDQVSGECQGGDTKDGRWWSNLSRPAVCRELLRQCVTRPDKLHLQDLLSLVSSLHSSRGLGSASLRTSIPT